MKTYLCRPSLKTYLCRPSLWIVFGLAVWSPFGIAYAQDWIEAGMELWPDSSMEPSSRRSGEHSSASETYERVRRATVSMRVLERRLGSPAVVDSLGSGVVVHSDRRGDDRLVWIATSAHVVPCRARCSVRVELPSRLGGKFWRSAKVVRFDGATDLALLEARVPEDADFAVIEQRGEGMPQDARVLALGYPDPELLPETTDSRRIGRVSMGHLLQDSGSFHAEYRALSSKGADGRLMIRHAVLHTATLVPGASGGPLIDASGMVLGINTGALVSKKRGRCLRTADLINMSGGTTEDRVEEIAGDSCVYLASGLQKVWVWVEELKSSF